MGIAVAYTVVGFIAFLMTALRVMRLGSREQPRGTAEIAATEKPPCCAKVTAAASIWTDPCIFLLAGANLTFGFNAAFMNGYVNGNYAKKLGTFAPALMSATTVVVATGLSKVFGPLAATIGKGRVLMIGAVCFGLGPVSILVGGCCDTWGWGLIVLYMLQGSGRAVYESTNKGIFADFFPVHLQSAPSPIACYSLRSPFL